MVFSPDGRYVATGSFDTTLRLWDLQNNSRLPQFLGNSGIIVSVAYSPDGQYVLTADTSHTVRLWNVARRKTVHTYIGHTNRVTCVAFSADGRRLISISGGVRICRCSRISPGL